MFFTGTTPWGGRYRRPIESSTDLSTILFGARNDGEFVLNTSLLTHSRNRTSHPIPKALKIDVHSHQIDEIFFDALRSLPGVTVKTNPDRFSYLLKDGKTWLPFRPEMFDPDHLIREMDSKGIDMSIMSMNTPSVYVFEAQQRIDLAAA